MFVFDLSTAIDSNSHSDTYSRQFPLCCFVPFSVQQRYPFAPHCLYHINGPLFHATKLSWFCLSCSQLSEACQPGSCQGNSYSDSQSFQHLSDIIYDSLIPSICLRYCSHLSESHSCMCYALCATMDIIRSIFSSLRMFHLFIVIFCAFYDTPRCPEPLFRHFQCLFHLHSVPL